MKRIIFIGGVVVITLLSQEISAQSDCKVLLPGINERYNGSCKKGLADGPGEAFGKDHYKGNFKKGLPDGNGTYTWQTGEVYSGDWKQGLRNGEGKYTFKSLGGDSVQSGVWKADKYIGNKAVPPYIIEYRNNIGRISCIKVGDRPYVKYEFSMSGTQVSNVSNIMLQGSSGTERIDPVFTGFEQVTFPFKGKVTFNAPSALMTTLMNCELRFTINNPGAWVVTIFY